MFVRKPEQLARLAREAGLVTLACCLEVAEFEAKTQLKSNSDPNFTLD